MITAGGLTRDRAPRSRSRASRPARRGRYLTTICPGVTERSTSWPTAFSVTCSTKSRATGSATSASSKATRTSRIAARTSASRERAAPAKPVEYAAEPIAQRVEHSNLLNDAERPYGEHQTQNDAGGRNLVGRRAPLGAQHRCMSVKTRRRLAAHAAKFNPAAACPWAACAAAMGRPAAARLSGRPARRCPCAGPRGGPRRSEARPRRSGTRSIGRDCCICWRGPTA